MSRFAIREIRGREYEDRKRIMEFGIATRGRHIDAIRLSGTPPPGWSGVPF